MTYKILSKFIKDLSFEIPDTQTLVSLEKNIKKYNIEIDLSAKPIKNDNAVPRIVGTRAGSWSWLFII